MIMDFMKKSLLQILLIISVGREDYSELFLNFIHKRSLFYSIYEFVLQTVQNIP